MTVLAIVLLAAWACMFVSGLPDLSEARKDNHARVGFRAIVILVGVALAIVVLAQ